MYFYVLSNWIDFNLQSEVAIQTLFADGGLLSGILPAEQRNNIAQQIREQQQQQQQEEAAAAEAAAAEAAAADTADADTAAADTAAADVVNEPTIVSQTRIFTVIRTMLVLSKDPAASFG